MPNSNQQVWSKTESIEAGAKALVAHLYQSWKSEAVLVRAYLAAPFDKLPPARRQAALRAAPTLEPSQPVLSLMGSYGAEADWQDAYRSRGHLAIPLVSAQQVESIPMVHALFEALGSPLAPKSQVRRMIGGGENALFYVADANTERDARGRAVVPATDFVRRYGVKTVIASGGLYMDREFLCVIAFFSVLVERKRAERLAVGMTAFKAAMTRRIRDGQLFET